MKPLLRDERGMALLVALATLVIISFLGAGALTVAGGSINRTMWDKSSNQAFGIAEAGFDQAVARARNDTLDTDGFKINLANGEASVTVTDLGNSVYRVKSVGAQPDFANPKARRAVQAIITAIGPYDIFYAKGAAGTVLGSSTFDGPLYVKDELSLSGDGAFTGGPLFIKDNPGTANPTGDLVLAGNAKVGTDAEPIYAFIDGTYPSGSSNLHTKAIYSDVPDFEMPVITGSVEDMTAQKNSADLVIDSDPSNPPNGNNALTLDRNAANQTHGTYPGGPYLKRTKTSNKKRTLEIDGIVFVDGPVVLGANQINEITFEGSGTIIANGNIAVNSEFKPNLTSEFPVTSAVGFDRLSSMRRNLPI